MSVGAAHREAEVAARVPPPPLTEAQVREALGLEAGAGAGSGERDVRFTAVCADSREVGPGALFVALPGERHHGADFLEAAAAAGADGAVVPSGRQRPELDLVWFPVDDPLGALADLARWRRRRTAARVVGVTGSSGKTTVKEMIAAALGAARRVYATPGNYNSKVGLPLTILAAPGDAEVWVLEMGASEPGEIGILAGIAAPDDAVVTTVGPAHLEWFGSVEGVLREKLSLVRGASREGAVVVGERPPELAAAARRLRPDSVVAGIEAGADFRPEPTERHGTSPGRAWFERDGVRFEVAAGGLHHLRDALIAAAVAEALGVPAAEAARGLRSFRPLGLRGALRRLGRLDVLADCYNANPESFEAAVRYLAEAFPARRRVAVIGTMLEMGEAGPAAHRAVLEGIVEAGFALVAATGDFAAPAAALEAEDRTPDTRFLRAEDPMTVWPALGAALRGDEAVLLKASRGVRLERLLERLEARFGEEAGG